MIGLGLGMGVALSQGSGGPARAPGYVPTVTTAPYAAYGAQRVIAGYAGPLYQVRSATGSTLDVYPQTGGDYPSRDAINTWAAANGGTPLTVPALYDQTGNARHMAQATVAGQPSFDTTIIANGVAPILIDGENNSPPVLKSMSVGSLGLDLIANSMFMTVHPNTSFTPDGFVAGSTEDATLPLEEFLAGQALGNLVVRAAAISTGTTIGTVGTVPRAQPNVVGFSNSATTLRMYANDLSFSAAQVRITTAIARLTLGRNITAGTSFNGRFRLFSKVVYDATLSPADAAIVIAGLKVAHSLTVPYDYRIVFDGDSIGEGIYATRLKNTLAQIPFVRNPDMWNTAIPGQTMAQCYANRVARFANLYTSARQCIYIGQAGTNDIATGTTGANLYANSTALQIAYIKGLGYKYLACTLLPRTSLTAPQELERLAYNALVLANTAGADYVLDLASNPTMGPVPAASNVLLYVDGVHPSSLGHAYLAGGPNGTYSSNFTYYYALSQLLGTAP